MRMSEYQELAVRTMARDLHPRVHRAVVGLGIAGEAGEVADLIKKEVGHGHPADVDKILHELGDVLWYVAAVADAYDLGLEHVAQANIAKLQARYPEGFSTERSLNRAE